MSQKRLFDIGIGQESDSQIVTVAVTVGGGGGVLNWRETLVEFCDDAPLTPDVSPVGVREVVGKALNSQPHRCSQWHRQNEKYRPEDYWDRTSGFSAAISFAKLSWGKGEAIRSPS